MLFDERNDLLARGGGDRADDMAACMVSQQLTGTFEIGPQICVRIEEKRLDDFVMQVGKFANGEFGAGAGISAHGPVRSRGRIKDADLQRVFHDPAK